MTARGFSILELVIVLSIVGIMAAIAVPRYGRAVDRSRVEQAAARVAHDLRQASDRARAMSAPYHAVFSTTKDYYRLAEGVYTKTGLLDRQSVVLLSQDPYLTRIIKVGFGAGDNVGVTFDGYGRPDNAGLIYLRAGNHYRLVTLDASGGTSISIPGVNPAPDPKPDPISL